MSGGNEAVHGEAGMLERTSGITASASSLSHSAGITAFYFDANPNLDYSADSSKYVYVLDTTIPSMNGFYSISTSTSGRLTFSQDISASTLAISNFTNGGAAGDCLFTTGTHGLAVGDTVYITKATGNSVASAATNLYGDHKVSVTSATTTFEIDVTPGAISDTTGQAFKGSFAGNTLQLFDLGPTAVQLVGCVRYPIGAAYTTVGATEANTDDALVTKTGCI
tara:strand:+ start:805 stop:1473 length:669 start_codon:yes stop_codon:yes gene_type:complete